MHPPAEAAHHMAAANRLERRVERGAADRVVDHVEAATSGMKRDIILDGVRPVIDRNGAERRDEILVPGRSRCKDLRPAGTRELDGDVTDPARAAMHQDRPTGVNGGVVDESLPRRDED